jgi:lipopolysaccharide/colanic/teichoic acid biosynthesis glycosyltransferase
MNNLFVRFITLIIILFLIPLYFVIFFFILMHFVNPIYTSKRLGLNGKLFMMYKFVTLKPNLVKGYLTTSNDISFFYFSKFLRNSKIDELPQLFNIIFGHMNWVGPRPSHPKIIDLYKNKDKEIILSVKPGLTDISSLIYGIKSDSFIKSKNEFEYFQRIEKKKIFFRKLYINNKSLMLNLKIIIYTIFAYLSIIKINEKNYRKYFNYN